MRGTVAMPATVYRRRNAAVVSTMCAIVRRITMARENWRDRVWAPARARTRAHRNGRRCGCGGRVAYGRPGVQARGRPELDLRDVFHEALQQLAALLVHRGERHPQAVAHHRAAGGPDVHPEHFHPGGKGLSCQEGANLGPLTDLQDGFSRKHGTAGADVEELYRGDIRHQQVDLVGGNAGETPSLEGWAAADSTLTVHRWQSTLESTAPVHQPRPRL